MEERKSRRPPPLGRMGRSEASSSLWGGTSGSSSGSTALNSPTPESGLSRRFWETKARTRAQSDTCVMRLIRRARAKKAGKSRTASREEKVGESAEELDPVYVAIKQAGELYAKTRAKSRSSANSSAADLRKQDSLGSRGSLSHNGGSDPSVLRVPSATPSGTPSRKASASEGPAAGPQGPSGPLRRPPQLDKTMKSLSLDSPDATPYTLSLGLGKGKSRSANRSASPHSAARNARLLSAPKLIKNCSIETDETDYTSASASPCPSPCVGSASSLCAAEAVGWVATREYRQRCPEDLGIAPGDLVHIVDTSDPQWYHGFKAGEDHVGIFPVACVGRILAGERVAQVVQNLTLSHPPRQIRLHKDQILFTHGQPAQDHTIPIRTEKGYRATCPVQYLVFLT